MLDQAHKDQYWKAVELALEVFGKSTELARQYRKEIEETAPPSQEELVYHTEPIDIAKDLAGRRTINDKQLKAYLRKLRSLASARRRRTGGSTEGRPSRGAATRPSSSPRRKAKTRPRPPATL
jgi:hypothetical protein